jgi:hypothetical protein
MSRRKDYLAALHYAERDREGFIDAYSHFPEEELPEAVHEARELVTQIRATLEEPPRTIPVTTFWRDVLDYALQDLRSLIEGHEHVDGAGNDMRHWRALERRWRGHLAKDHEYLTFEDRLRLQELLGNAKHMTPQEIMKRQESDAQS